MSTALAPVEIRRQLEHLPGWSCRQNRLQKTFHFSNFREAMGFVVRVSFEAESLNHHPEWSNVYDRVEVSLRTHDAGNRVTELDFELARRMEKLSWTE